MSNINPLNIPFNPAGGAAGSMLAGTQAANALTQSLYNPSMLKQALLEQQLKNQQLQQTVPYAGQLAQSEAQLRSANAQNAMMQAAINKYVLDKLNGSQSNSGVPASNQDNINPAQNASAQDTGMATSGAGSNIHPPYTAHDAARMQSMFGNKDNLAALKQQLNPSANTAQDNSIQDIKDPAIKAQLMAANYNPSISDAERPTVSLMQKYMKNAQDFSDPYLAGALGKVGMGSAVTAANTLPPQLQGLQDQTNKDLAAYQDRANQAGKVNDLLNRFDNQLYKMKQKNFLPNVSPTVAKYRKAYDADMSTLNSLASQLEELVPKLQSSGPVFANEHANLHGAFGNIQQPVEALENESNNVHKLVERSYIDNALINKYKQVKGFTAGYQPYYEQPFQAIPKFNNPQDLRSWYNSLPEDRQALVRQSLPRKGG